MIVRDWEPGESFATIFATPAQWQTSKPDVPGEALRVVVYPAGRS